jgi:colanic acid/amylovoran biosynthesis glycosyltransferase
MDLFLFTNTFPYQNSEPFLVNEYQIGRKYCQSISVLSLYGSKGGTEQAGLDYQSYVLDYPLHRSALLVKGLANLVSFKYHLADFFKRKVFLSPVKFSIFSTSALVTRASLKSAGYTEMKRRIQNAEKPVLYFFWGENLCWLLPYLTDEIKRKDLKIIIRLHRTDLYENLKGNYSPLRTLIFSQASLILPVSEDGEKFLVSKYPQFASKIHTSRLGVFDNGLNKEKSSKTFVVVSASYVTPVKRVHLIFNALVKSNLEITWHHFGDGPLFEALSELIHNTDSPVQVKLHGKIENSDLLRFYKENHVDLFINSSSSEGLPVSIMEALSFGIPIIAPAVGGIAEIVNAANGILLSPDFGINELAAAVKAIHSLSDEKRSELRENARKMFAQKLSADHNYNIFYRELVNLCQ